MADELEIVFSDEHIAVVVKPSGMLSVPGKGEEPSVVCALRKRYPQCISHPAAHRLDMDTSGLMVLGLTVESQRALSIQFQQRTVCKVYEAELVGIVDGEQGEIELPFRLDVENRPMQIYDPLYGKVGITRWRKLVDKRDRSRVEFHPVTGRTHQLRVHASHEKGLGKAIVGDTLYGGHDKHGELRLHAKELGFEHPVSGHQLTYQSMPSW